MNAEIEKLLSMTDEEKAQRVAAIRANASPLMRLRHAVEDALSAVGKVTGAGAMVDHSEADVSVVVDGQTYWITLRRLPEQAGR